MTDDRDDISLDHDAFGADASLWDAALNNAFADFMFPSEPNAAAHAGTPDDGIHAAFEALMFAAHSAPAPENKHSVTAWIANDDAAPEGYGRVMFSRDVASNAQDQLSGVIAPDGPQITANTVIASGRAANDNAIWIGSDGGDHFSGVYGRDANAAVLDNGDALIAWIGADESIHARFVAADHGHDGLDQSEGRSKLDQMLMSLGESAAASGGKAGRLAVTALGANSFAALWTTEFAINSVLMGTILTLGTAAHAKDGDEAADDVTWSVQDIAPQIVPAGTTAFSVAVTDIGALTVTYATEGGAQSGDNASSIIHFDAGESLQAASWTSDDADASSTHAGAEHVVPLHHANGDGMGTPHTAVWEGTSAHSTSGQQTSHHTSDDTHHLEPSVAVSDDGTTYTGHFGAPNSPGGNPPYIIEQLHVDGRPDVPPIIITDALPADTDHPALNVAPTITGTHDGVAVTYVTKQGAGPETVKSVQVEAFDGHGKPVGDGPVTVATAQGTEHSFSDVTVGYTHSDSGQAAHTDAGSGFASETSPADAGSTSTTGLPETEIAPSSGVMVVAFIADAAPDGFGTLKAQLYAVPDETAPAGSDQGLTALGADGHAGGDSDAVFELAPDADCRAPAIEGLDHGSLAVAWVEETNQGNGPDVIRGVILTPGDDVAPETIDLSPLMPQGVAEGTDPVLASDDAGDLIVGWIQSLLSGGYEAESAIYRHSGHHDWTPPSSTISLGYFDALPHDFAISVSGTGDNLSLVVAWRGDDNSISTVHYDVGSGQMDQPVVASLADGSGSVSDVALIANSDSSVLVTVSDSDNDHSGIAATIIQAADQNSSGDSGNDHSGSGGGSSGSDGNIGSGSDGSGPGSSASDHSGHGGGDTGTETSTPESAATAPVQEQATSSLLTVAIVNFASDLIEFVSSGSADATGSAPQLIITPAMDTGSDIAPPAAPIPTMDDVAALQAMATASSDGDAKKGSSSGSSNSSGSDTSSTNSSSGSYGSDHDLSSTSTSHSDTDGSQNSGSGKNAGTDSGHGSNDPSLGGSANDNTSPSFHDAPLAIATGYGNDIADYISPDEQAALIPEPVSVLFEALQFANAFNDAANSDVLHFDSTNVVTISQFMPQNTLDPNHNVPLI